MAEETTVTPATSTPIPTSVPTPAPAPVTTQTVQPDLEVKQAADTLDALNKLFDEHESKPTPVVPLVETKPTEPAPAGVTPLGTSDFQSRLDAFKAPAGAHPNVAAGMDQLKNLAKEAETRAQEAQTKIKTYEEQLKEFNEFKTGVKLPDPIKQELETLRQWRREMDLRQDPEFQKNYIQPVRQAEFEAMSLLKQAGMSDEVEKFIMENGGIIALSQSSESAGIKDKPNMTMAEWVEKMLLGEGTPAVFRTRILGKLTQAQDHIERGRSELQDFHQNSKERWEARMKKMEQEFNSGRDEAIAELGDLNKPKEISASATPEERVAAEAHNNMLREAVQKYGEILQANKDPKTAGKLLAKSVQTDMLLKLYHDAAARIKLLEEKLTGIKSAGSHSQAGDRAVVGQDKPPLGSLLKQSTEQAMNDLFKAHPSL